MLDTNTISTPANNHIQLQLFQDVSYQLLTIQLFKEAIGSLMYAMVVTKPDISCAVSKVATFQAPPQ